MSSIVPSVVSAILELEPNSKVIVQEDDINKIIWRDGNPSNISKKQIQDKLAELEADYDSKEYQRKREPEYPNIGDQLDALYHAGVFPAEMTATLKAVKDKYPKG